ncbi:MAG: histidinol dehydrogenase [Candidatus Margulisiibacteriota bacterium]|nr:MAG: histidinol dehydrogenase [Candidatus Margulisbacteria bacterium GWD2_39_127]OGI05330.1 MAG: histidinol dehydrogenase [Candidatus Margulisbacteria bacterium GWF2_38_17]OGI06045.1 MAG: histidinol dehydrogenase [Candidatus Margulisbacteria bacterium GWE2_39_32]PZM77315.1 MAG: histidinol dehydrogenase [Candidatus Margulisiibacteriota bacterium]HAR62569.1 histidinol dehydrogenase [Candidatus Margulisiibacteriota bacterium]
MIRIIEDNIIAEVNKLIDRASLTFDRKEEPIVKDILANVAAHGDKALIEYTNRFDKTNFAHPANLTISREEIEQAVSTVEPEVFAALTRAIKNIEDHHKQQKHESWTYEPEPGASTGIRYTPLASVGVYVPGGTAAYPSTVLMNVIPAKVAGVEEIVMVTPPSSSGEINKYILAAAYLLGVSKIFKIGGAQAVAALAFGTETVPRVDKIVGPGNIWVTLAKKQVYGTVAIDKLAGPSDITVLADSNAPAPYVAADLLSQAEHDVLASSIAIVLSKEQAQKIQQEVIAQTSKLPRKTIVEASLKNYGAIIVVKSVEEMIVIANTIAPEHLEIMFRDPNEILPHIKNAGAIFCGYYTPEPLGDYYAGSNHVLPTGGTSRFESPLGVDDFVKKTSIIQYSREKALATIGDIELLARLEGFDAHAYSMSVRRQL